MAAQISYTRSGERTERETAGSGHRGWSFLTATGGSEVEVVVVVRRQCLRHRPGSRATRLGLRGAARRGEEGGRGGHFRVGGRLLPCRGRRGVENGLEQLNNQKKNSERQNVQNIAQMRPFAEFSFRKQSQLV